MSLQSISINESYETGNGDPVNDFFIPVLSHAIKYDRIAGYFSSSSLAIAARGISGLITNGGKMRIIASPNLSEEDIVTIKKSVESPEIFIENKLILELNNIEDDFQRNHIEALGWLLAKGLLEIRLAFVISKNKDTIDESALFHQKVGILQDASGNKISFSGSINETASGWLNNIEEFKVFKSWEVGQALYLENDFNKFCDFWDGKRENVRVVGLSEAIKSKLIQIGENFSREDFIAKKYVANIKHKTLSEKLSLFFYQKKAVDEWKENNFSLLMEMATGTGKTRTAIACIYEVMSLEKKLITIISCPQSTLSKQWKNEIENIGLKSDDSLIVDGTNKRWRNDLKESIKKISVGYRVEQWG